VILTLVEEEVNSVVTSGVLGTGSWDGGDIWFGVIAELVDRSASNVWRVDAYGTATMFAGPGDARPYSPCGVSFRALRAGVTFARLGDAGPDSSCGVAFRVPGAGVIAELVGVIVVATFAFSVSRGDEDVAARTFARLGDAGPDSSCGVTFRVLGAGVTAELVGVIVVATFAFNVSRVDADVAARAFAGLGDV